MKQFNSENIERRAQKLLDYHVAVIDKNGRDWVQNGKHCYIHKWGNNRYGDYVEMTYNKSKKLLSRSFNLELKSHIHSIEFENDFKIKLQFSGVKEIKSAKFVGKKECQEYLNFFNSESLLNDIRNMAKKVEIAYVIIEYEKVRNNIIITVAPYPGAFLWIVFPPVFYDMKLKREELDVLLDMSYRITNFIDDKVC